MVEINQKEIEQKWQKKWRENRVFQPKIDNSKEKYFVTVAYPYANSVMHIGHGRTNTIADIYARYQRVNGKNVLFPMGFHITGTPVLAVSDMIAKDDEKQWNMMREAISDYIKDEKEQNELITSFKDPMKIAEFFSSKIEETFDSIGLSIDWSRQFTTGDKQYNKFIEWQFKKLQEENILVQGSYPILYSYVDKNAVGEDDIKDGDTDRVTVQDMTYIKFKVKDEEEYVVCATLRPDSIFGATNIYAKSDMELVKLEVNGAIWIVSEDSVNKIKHQFQEVREIAKFKGEELIGKTLITPIIDREIPIYHADFPDSKHGTGIVYSSPADSPHDYINLFEVKFPGKALDEFQDKDPLELTKITETKDKKGEQINYKDGIPAYDKLLKFKIYKTQGNEELLEKAKQELYKEAHYGAIMVNCGDFDGTPIKHGQKKTTEKLIELGLGGTFYETSRRAKTRSGDEVIVALLENQWFLDYSKDDTKEKAYSVLDNMTYRPDRLRQTQKSYLEWVQMRPCARRRGLGTKLPFDKEWVIEALSDSTIYQMFYHMSKLIYGEDIDSEKLEFEVFDYVFLGEGNPTLIEENTGITKEKLDEMREEVNYWKSFDLRYTAATHMSNHLSFLIYHYGIIFPKTHWPNNITIGGLLIKDGEKISKSKGNGIPLFRMKDIYGVDLYRLYVSVGANYDIEMDFRDEDIFQLEKKFNKWKDLMFSSVSRENREYDSFNDLSKWLISKFYSRSKEYFENMEHMRIREAYVAILYEYLTDISYHERRNSPDETLDVMRFIVEDYIKLMTPTVSHICEEINEKLGDKDYISLKSFNMELSEKYISKYYENVESIGQELLTTVARIRETNNVSQPKRITIVQAKESRFKLFEDLKQLLENTKEFKKIIGELNSKYAEDSKFIQKFVPKTLGSGLSYYLNRDEEKNYLESLKTYLEEEYKCEVIISDANSIENSNNSIIPGEPGVFVE